MLTLKEAYERLNDPARLESMAEIVAQLSDADRMVILDGVDMEELQGSWSFWGRPKQIIPDDPYYNIHLLLAGRGFGKGLVQDTPINTPTGWTTIGEIKEGDQVFDEHGKPCNVVIAHEPYMPEKLYRVTFSDGTYLDADGPHQWVTWNRGRRIRNTKSTGSPTFPPDWAVNYKQYKKNSITPDEADFVRTMRDNDGTSWRTLADFLGRSIHGVKNAYYRGASVINYVQTTEELLNTVNSVRESEPRHMIPAAGTLEYASHEGGKLPIHPWVLGYCLGDAATLDPAYVACHPEQEEFLRSKFASLGYPTKDSSQPYHFRVLSSSNLRKNWTIMGLHRGKFVPEAYLRASKEDRLELLRGLVDSDGHVDKYGCVQFTNTNESLVDAVVELVNSLGGIAKKYGYKNRYGVPGKYVWNVYFWFKERAAHLPCKYSKQRYPNTYYTTSRGIVSIEEIPPETVRCLTVDSKNSMFLAGKSNISQHNTRAMSEFVRTKALENPGTRIGILGRSAADTRDVTVTGESGILSLFYKPEDKPVYKASEAKVVWPNGSEAKLHSAEVPDAVRGAQYEFSIVDEIAAHTPYTDGAGLTAFQNLRLATRLGEHPCLVVATTPKRIQVLKDLLEDAKDPKNSIRVVQGSTMENKSNLSSVYLNVIQGQYEGTSIYAQEIHGEVLDEEPEGALWAEDSIKLSTLTEEQARRLPIRVVGVDPTVSDSPLDEAGIIAFGATRKFPLHRRRGVVLEDASIKGTPQQWAKKVVDTVRKWDAWGVVIESNQGFELLRMVINQIDESIRVVLIPSSKSKKLRAEPISQIYEQNRITHLREFPLLNNQMTTWEPGVTKKSPDRVDALVFAATAAMVKPPKGLDRKKIRSIPPKTNVRIP